jgi:hypothetical protein
MAHLVFPNPQADPSAKPKEPFFCQRTTENINFENYKLIKTEINNVRTDF